jgi:hypothetical protein
MNDPEDKKEQTPSKSGITPGEKSSKQPDKHGKEGPGTITEVAPEAQGKSHGPIKEVAPDVQYGQQGPGTITEVAPEAQSKTHGPIKELAPDVKSVRPEVAPELGQHRASGPIKEMAPDVGSRVHPEVAPEVGSTHGAMRVLYGPTIQDAIAKGDLPRMKQLVAEAQRQLDEWGDLRASLEHLKIEIARLEHKQKAR